MDKFIPYGKLSKKKRRETDAVRREIWNLNPVTRRPANPKSYNRRKAQKWRDDSISVPFLFCAALYFLNYDKPDLQHVQHGVQTERTIFCNGGVFVDRRRGAGGEVFQLRLLR